MTLPEQIHETEAELSLAKATESRRRAAEASYVVARLYRAGGDIEAAKLYARESFFLFTKQRLESLCDSSR